MAKRLTKEQKRKRLIKWAKDTRKWYQETYLPWKQRQEDRKVGKLPQLMKEEDPLPPPPEPPPKRPG